MAKVDLDSLPHNSLAIKDLLNSDRGVFIEKGDNYPSEGFQGGPRVYWCGGVDEVFDGLEVVWTEYLRI